MQGDLIDHRRCVPRGDIALFDDSPVVAADAQHIPDAVEPLVEPHVRDGR
jgi:hypothetical protein